MHGDPVRFRHQLVLTMQLVGEHGWHVEGQRTRRTSRAAPLGRVGCCPPSTGAAGVLKIPRRPRTCKSNTMEGMVGSCPGEASTAAVMLTWAVVV